MTLISQDAHLSLGGDVGATLEHVMEVMQDMTFRSSSSSSGSSGSSSTSSFLKSRGSWGSGPSAYGVGYAHSAALFLQTCSIICDGLLGIDMKRSLANHVITVCQSWHHHASHVTRHTSHVTRHTSHVTRHTSHVTGLSAIALSLPLLNTLSSQMKGLSIGPYLTRSPIW